MSKVSLRWMGGAGFVVETGSLAIGIDLYLSNSCMSPDGAYKRLTQPPVNPEDLALDYLIASHEHGDHLDVGIINKLIREDNGVSLICPAIACRDAMLAGVDPGRIIELNRGQTLERDGFSVRAVMADHGENTPDAIGFFLKIEDKVIYFMGDTCYRADLQQCVGGNEPIDALLVPINGKFGNPGSSEAAAYVRMFKPKIAIPCHFWLFSEHGGDPGGFLECCEQLETGTEIRVLAIGESTCL